MTRDVTWADVLSMAKAAGVKPDHRIRCIMGHFDLPLDRPYRCQMYPLSDDVPHAYLPKTIHFTQEREQS